MLTDVEVASSSGLLTLLSLRGVGPVAATRLMGRFRTLSEIREATDTELQSAAFGEALHSLRDPQAWNRALHHAETILDQAGRRGVRVLTIADDTYPENLRAISDRPLVLYVKGRLNPSRRAVACIGTREPSSFGELATRGIVTELVRYGWSIVSGLALGIDTIAHQTSLASGGHTVAILGNGLDSVYPRKNTALADRIVAEGGALLSEQPFGSPPTPRNLVQRDRIQTGMALGTIVMQTDLVGGSMHGVRFTLVQGRLLFAPVPHGPHRNENKSRGLLALIEKPGPDLSGLVKTEPEYEQLLRTRYADRPVAIPISSRNDYDHVLSTLEQAHRNSMPRHDAKADGASDRESQPRLF